MPNLRKRVLATKPSKSGCRTCRIRRVKCDEIKPSCNKCTSTGRSCDGYEIRALPRTGCSSQNVVLAPARAGPGKNGMLANPPPPFVRQPSRSMASHMDATEYYAYDFFLRETADPLRSMTPAKEWVQIALQMSIDIKPVMHAIAAVGAAHRAHSHISHASLAGLIMPEDQMATIQLYGKAVASLQTQIDAVVERRATLEPVLLACLLLVCYEVLLARHQQAVAHCRLGWNIIKKSCNTMNTSARSAVPAQSQATISCLVEAFRKLGGETFAASGNPETVPDYSFGVNGSVSDASELLRSELNALIDQGEDIMEELRRLASSQVRATYGESMDTDTRYCLTYCVSRSVLLPPGSSIQSRLQTALVGHHTWLAAYNAFMGTTSCTVTSRELTLLRIRHFVSSFSLSTCRETFEILADRFENEFVRVLDLIDGYLDRREGKPARLPHSADFTDKDADAGVNLDVGILPALRLIAFKSRTSRIRHRALDTLLTARRREGLSWSPVVAVIASSVVAHEEQAARALNPGLSATDDLSCEQVPEVVRFTDVITHGMRGNRVMIKLVCARYAHENDGTVRITRLRGDGRPSSSQTTGRSFFDVKTIDYLSWETDGTSDDATT